MIIEIEIGKNYDDLETQNMAIDGKHILFVEPLNGCAEDATIERDLVSCKMVSSFMLLAYNAGKNGEKFDVHITAKPVDG